MTVPIGTLPVETNGQATKFRLPLTGLVGEIKGKGSSGVRVKYDRGKRTVELKDKYSGETETFETDVSRVVSISPGTLVEVL